MKRILAIVFLLSSANLIGQNALYVPPTITGNNFTLNLQTGTTPFFAGPQTATMGVNGNLLGPTLIFEKDSFVNITVNNNLTDTTTMHWHGLHVSPENDGGPHSLILPGSSWNPQFTVMDKAATYWYHPHLHSKTNEHVVRGIAGMLIVKDAEEAALNLPRTYGVDDFPLIFQTKAFDASNQLMIHSNEDSIFMVNGTINPYVDVPAQVVRMRLLNGSSMRTYEVGFSNNMSFSQIASDGGLLAAPVSMTRLRISPGERMEILVDLSGLQSQTIQLVNYCEELPIGIYGAEYPGMNQFATMPGYGNNPLNLTNYDMLELNVVAPTGSPVTTIPPTLVNVVPLLEANANNTRTLSFGTYFPGVNFLNNPFHINGHYFRMDSINEYITLNDIEVWTINNNTQTTHPFHIHDVQFYILDRDGNAPPVHEQGRKDVVRVSPFETVRFIAQFNDHESDTVPYMYHCHMLPHEDEGMMGQFIVSSTLTNVDENLERGINLKVYPNPSADLFYLESDQPIGEVQLLDMTGKQVWSTSKPGYRLDLSGLEQGMYLLRLEIGEQQVVKKIIKE